MDYLITLKICVRKLAEGVSGWVSTDALDIKFMIDRAEHFEQELVFSVQAPWKAVAISLKNSSIAPSIYVNFCLMKKARKCESCQAQVTPSTTSCNNVHLTTLAFVDSD